VAELRVGAATDTGRLRAENEDNMLVADGIFVVADGMGGHEAGEVASQIAVDRIGERLGGAELPTAEAVVDAIITANSDIFRAAIANPEQRGMGTTATAIAVIADHLAGRGAPNIDTSNPVDADPPGETDSDVPGDVTPIRPSEPTEALVLANVGDSRTYLFRHDRLRRVTVDHSYVQELVATGHITEEEARTHPRRNIVTRALGIEPDVRVDWWTLPLIRGDRFVLCSDGLVDEVADLDITSTLILETDPQDAAERLVEKANEAGGRDNITVIVIDVLEGDDPPDPTLEIDVVPIWADEGADPTPAGPLEVDADPTDTAQAISAEDPDSQDAKNPRKGPVRFAIAFGIAVVLVIVFVLFSVWARSGYYIAFNEDDEAIIYRGRAGGVLWIEPTAENEVGPTRDELTPEAAETIDGEPRFDSFDAAVQFLQDGLIPVPSTTTTTTTTTTSTTTTVAAGVTTSSGP
jgi:serine/threonine protein phosphatase PrpC